MWTLLSFAAFTLMVAALSYWKTRGDDRGSSEGYFLGGRNLRWYFIAGSLLLTNLSSEQMVGLNGGGYTHGMVVMAWEVVAAVTMVFMAIFMLREYLRRGIATIPDFVAQRYDRQLRDLLTAVSLFQMIFLVLPFILYSGALALNAIFRPDQLLGISETQSLWLMIVLTGVVGSIYAIGGGLRAVAVSDTINGIGLVIGGFLVPFFAVVALGEGSLTQGLNTLVSENPQRLNPVGGPTADIPFSTLFTGMLFINFAYWCTTQYIIQRTFATRSLAQGQKGILFAAAMKLLGPLYLVLPGILAWHIFGPDLEAGDYAYPNLVNAVMPDWLAGFFAAVLFGAVLSSFNSTLNSAATIFSLNFYQPLRKQAGDREVIAAGKVFGIVVAVASVVIAPLIAYSPEGLFNLMKKIGSVFCAVPMIVVLGMFNRRIPPIAAKIAFVIGVVLYSTLAYGFEHTYFGHELNWLHTVAFSAGVPSVFMLIFGWLKPYSGNVSASETESVEGMDLEPWKWARPVGALVLVLVVGVYAGLWYISGGGWG
ncbi:MAG: solute:sodium symporter family transporter [Opitutales bacterium]